MANPSLPGGASLSAPDTNSGAGGLVRPRRRVIRNTVAARPAHTVQRNYAVSNAVVFTNFEELKNDQVSAAYAQEIIEEFIGHTGVDMGNSNAMKMVEDIIFTHIINNGASNKTNYEHVLDVYGTELDLALLLRVLVSHVVTPRRFARGLANRIYKFIGEPENNNLRAALVARFGLENPDDARLAFDGSTHITGLTPNQQAFANMLASRGLYDSFASTKSAAGNTTYDAEVRNNNIRNTTVSGGAA